MPLDDDRSVPLKLIRITDSRNLLLRHSSRCFASSLGRRRDPILSVTVCNVLKHCVASSLEFFLFDLIPLETIVRLCKDREIRKLALLTLFYPPVSNAKFFLFVRFFEYIDWRVYRKLVFFLRSVPVYLITVDFPDFYQIECFTVEISNSFRKSTIFPRWYVARRYRSVTFFCFPFQSDTTLCYHARSYRNGRTVEKCHTIPLHQTTALQYPMMIIRDLPLGYSPTVYRCMTNRAYIPALSECFRSIWRGSVYRANMSTAVTVNFSR